MHIIAAICYNKCYEDDYCIQEERRCGWGANLNLCVSKTNMQCLGCISQVVPKWHLGFAQAEAAGLFLSLCAVSDGEQLVFVLQKSLLWAMERFCRCALLQLELWSWFVRSGSWSWVLQWEQVGEVDVEVPSVKDKGM